MELNIPIIPRRPACRRLTALRPSAMENQCSTWQRRTFRLIRAGLLGAGLVFAGAVAAAEIPLAFGTDGGDAWKFSKSIEVTFAKGRCENISVVSPLSDVTLPAERGHVQTRVLLQ